MRKAPESLGKYVIRETLGRGAMGTVYLADDPVIGREVAVKVIHGGFDPSDYQERQLAERFEREFRVAGTLSHPNIVTIYEAGRAEDGRWFIAMEHMAGRALNEIAAQQRFSDEEIARLAAQICDALDYAHERGVVHRDVKPHNILFTQDGRPKITDFGIATMASSSLTQTGSVIGTPSYMSPEQIVGKTLEGASDQFSVAVMFFELFTGALPFEGDSPTARMYKIVHDDPDFAAGAEGLPEPLVPVFARALSKMPEDRFPDCRSFAVAVWDALELEGSAPIQARRPTTTVAPDRPPALDAGHADTQIAPPKGKPREAGVIDSLKGWLRRDETVLEQAEREHATRYVIESPLETSIPGQRAGMSVLGGATAPTGFFQGAGLSGTAFYASPQDHYQSIQQTLEFYREHLHSEYANLLSQAKITFKLWVGCVVVGFVTFSGGVIAMLAGAVTQGAITTASTGIVFFIQRLFQQREDQYLKQARAKRRYLEYGADWLLAIQTIEAIEDPVLRQQEQARLVKVIRKKLKQSRRGEEQAGAGRAPAPQSVEDPEEGRVM